MGRGGVWLSTELVIYRPILRLEEKGPDGTSWDSSKMCQPSLVAWVFGTAMYMDGATAIQNNCIQLRQSITKCMTRRVENNLL